MYYYGKSLFYQAKDGFQNTNIKPYIIIFYSVIRCISCRLTLNLSFKFKLLKNNIFGTDNILQ